MQSLQPLAFGSSESSLRSEGPARELTDRDFERFQKLIHARAGIYLAPIKRALLLGRLGPRLRQLGIARFSDYYALVTSDPRELVEMLDRVCTNETHFFRDPRQFEFLRQAVIPDWIDSAERRLRERTVRIWSAACSTGEEPYSIAMLLIDALRHRQPSWKIEIVASDLSTRALERAEEGLWPADRAEEIPPELLRRYMLKGVRTQAGRIKAAPELRAVMRFHRHNLIDFAPATGKNFDLIFCRNVLMYFDAEAKRRVVSSLIDTLERNGYLFLGQSESLNGISGSVRSAGPAAYQRVSDGAERR